MSRDGALRVNVWRLLDDGIEGPIRLGINRAFKYDALTLTDEQQHRLEDTLHHELMLWFAETFLFGDEDANG